jgi:hypothetical protein
VSLNGQVTNLDSLAEIRSGALRIRGWEPARSGNCCDLLQMSAVSELNKGPGDSGSYSYSVSRGFAWSAALILAEPESTSACSFYSGESRYALS